MKALELQGAIYTRLSAFAALTALVGARIYDQPPADSAFPYVRIGAGTSVPHDTFSTKGAEHTVTIHVWDNVHAGEKVVKQIQQAIYDALHQYTSLVVAGATQIDCEWEFSTTFPDEDGRTLHGVSRFRVVLGGLG